MPEVPEKFQRLLDRLQGVREHKPGLCWSAKCPAHVDDTKPSLSVNIGETGNLVMSCHSSHGCTAQEIVKALGLTMTDLFRSDRADFQGRSSSPRRAPEVVYPYQYEDGTLAYETLRYKPKDFNQRRPNPDWKPGGTAPRYLYNLDGVRMVVYRLPTLLASWQASPDRWTALVEGEKCAEAMAAMDILSTTHALGSDHWRDEYAETFRGRRVAIFYDCDPYQARQRKRPGPAWAVQAARALYGIAACVRICHPPGCMIDSKDDVADFISRNLDRGTAAIKADLFKTIQATEDYFPGWENMTGFAARQSRHRATIKADPTGDMNEALDTVIRRLHAATNGVRLDSLADDLASAAAWCQWLAELVDGRMTVVNMKLDASVPPKISEATREENTAQAQDSTEAQNTNQELCVPAQIEAFQEPEIV